MVRPYDLYIRFLVTKGYSELDDINTNLLELALPKITEEELTHVHNQVFDLVPKPVASNIEKQLYTQEFISWMKILEVWDLWMLEKKFRNPDTAKLQLVYDINYDPEIRMCIRGLLTKRHKKEDLCQDMNFKFSYMLKVEHMDLYERFFWNPSRMNRAAWRKYLPLCDDQERVMLFLCLTERIEDVKIHLKLPSKIDLLATYNRLFTQCSHKINHYIQLNTQEANREVRGWADTMLQLGDKIKKYEAGSVEDFGKALQMEFDFVTSDFPTPDETVLAELRAAQKHSEELNQ